MGPPMDFHARLPSQIVDLTGRDESRTTSDYGGGSNGIGYGGAVVSFPGHPEYGAVPMSPAYPQTVDHGVQNVDDRVPPFHHFRAAPHRFDSLSSSAQGMRQRSHPHNAPSIYQEVHETQGHLKQISGSKEKKKAPKVVGTRPESRKKHGFLSNSPILSGLSR